jgi:hypothetical protein
LAALSGRPLLVLGMHRSGTSSFAGLAARLGAELGRELLEPNEFNPRGYAEHRGVVAIHDRFLASRGLAWDALGEPGPFEGEDAEAARAALRDLLLEEFAGAPLFALKDPRLCRLLPLWAPVLGGLGTRPACVLVLRHPLEIAASLERRDGFPRSRSLLLYLEHALAAERETRGLPRSFVRYDELFADWRGVAKRVASECALRWPRDPEAAAPEVEAFLAGDLRHHHAEAWSEDEAARYPWAAAAHAEVLELARRGPGAPPSAVLDDLGRALAAAAELYGPELALRDARALRLEAERREAEQAARRAERQRERLAASPRLWLRTFLGRALRRRGGRGA